VYHPPLRGERVGKFIPKRNCRTTIFVKIVERQIQIADF
jgi:hypothetical protein